MLPLFGLPLPYSLTYSLSYRACPSPWTWGFSALSHFPIASSCDGYTVFTQRGKSVGTRPKVYDTSVIERLSRPLDRGTIGEAPDVYRCACRGLAEELGLHESLDFSAADITVLCFGVDTRYALRGLTGMVKIKRNIDKLLQLWDNEVRDKFENQKLYPVPFTPEDAVSFGYTHQPFTCAPALYYALVHEFGRSIVEGAFESVTI